MRGGTIKQAFGTSIDGLSVSAAKKYTADLAVYGNVASRQNNMLVGHASLLSLLSWREKPSRGWLVKFTDLGLGPIPGGDAEMVLGSAISE